MTLRDKILATRYNEFSNLEIEGNIQVVTTIMIEKK